MGPAPQRADILIHMAKGRGGVVGCIFGKLTGSNFEKFTWREGCEMGIVQVRGGDVNEICGRMGVQY
jgi:hypothetical protein